MSEPSETRRAVASRSVPSLRRIALLLLGTLATAASLITFPSAVPWMIAFWLLWGAVLAILGRPAWMPLAACALILLAKGLRFSPGTLAVIGVLLITAGSRLAGVGGRPGRRRRLATGVQIAACWACGRSW